MNKKVLKSFGKDEDGFLSIPKKISNVKISRFLNYEKQGGCPYCFPHGMECVNSTYENIEKNWKKYRYFQYKKNDKKLNWKIYKKKASYRKDDYKLTEDNFYEILNIDLVKDYSLNFKLAKIL